MKMQRVGKKLYYLGIAEAVSVRATCLRRKFGAVIVVNDHIVATGYCGAPRGVEDCLRRGECFRKQKKIPSGQRYEMCRSVHAEMNAIINAARAGVSVLGGEMYVYGYCFETNKAYYAFPCLMCLKQSINAGLSRIYYTAPENKYGYGISSIDGVIQWWNRHDMFDKREELI